jgi:hypothetical protein
MPGSLYEYLSNDHDRLDALLERAIASPGALDEEAYAEFRKGLLRHISMEEKIVFPAMVKRLGKKIASLIDRLHVDHGVIVSLMAPPPSPSVVMTVQSILQAHNRIEEQVDGLYRLLEEAVGPEAEQLLTQLNSAPPVAVLPHNTKPEVLAAAKSAVERAGYEFKELSK